MRFSILPILSILSISSLGLANPEPLTQESTTRIALDNSPENKLATEGELVLHVFKTDDLLSDFTPSHERSLILERLTHLILRVQLSPPATSTPSAPNLLINNEPIDLSPLTAPVSEEKERRVVQVIKSEAMRLPKDGMVVEGKQMSQDELVRLGEHLLPKGVVSVELSILPISSRHSSLSLSSSSPTSDDDDSVEPTSDSPPADMKISMSSYNVFIRINSLEALDLPHSTTVMVPLLKLEVGEQGTWALRSLSPHAGPGRPRFEQGRARVGLAGAGRRGGKGGCRGRKNGPPAFVRWIADKLGFKPPHHRHHGPPPPEFFKEGGMRQHHEGEGEEHPHRHHHEHHGEGEDREMHHHWHHHGEGEGEDPEMRHAHPHSQHEHGRKFDGEGHPHPHHHHGPHSHFRHRLHHMKHHIPLSVLGALIFLKIALIGALLFVAIRRIKHRNAAKAEGVIRLPVGDEKEVVEIVVVDEKSHIEDSVAQA